MTGFMTGGSAIGKTEELTFCHFSGLQVTELATRLSQVRPLAGPQRDIGYEHLDNEILAGRRLHKVARLTEHASAVSFLYGDEAASENPYALLRPYRGEPLHTAVGQMFEDELQAFEVGLLTGLCWLAAAGVAHRGLSPATVRWDSHDHQVQITDFSQCTVFGVPRKAGGLVTNRDDMHAAGQLIYYLRSQGDDRRPGAGKLAELGLTDLEPLFGPPEARPTASEWLASHLGKANPVPRRVRDDPQLADGRSRFEFWWEKKGNTARAFPSDPAGRSRDDRSQPSSPRR
jgi:serine/threonine protein kinase